MAPNLLDANNVFTDNGTGFYLANVAGLNLTTPMSMTGSTTTGIHLKDCDGVTVDNQTLTGNVGTNGAIMIDDCGEFDPRRRQHHRRRPVWRTAGRCPSAPVPTRAPAA